MHNTATMHVTHEGTLLIRTERDVLFLSVQRNSTFDKYEDSSEDDAIKNRYTSWSLSSATKRLSYDSENVFCKSTFDGNLSWWRCGHVPLLCLRTVLSSLVVLFSAL